MMIRFASQSYKHDSLPVSAQRVLNLYAERQPPDARSPVTVHGVPGIRTHATLGEGPIRGFHMLGGVLYAVSGPWLYSVTNAAAPVVTRLGGQITGSGRVSMADNGDELMIVNGANGFVYDTTSGFRIVTDTDFEAANTVTFLDGFFLFDQAGTNQFRRSDLLSGTSYEALAFAAKESKSDNVLAVVNVKQVLHVLGVTSSELWANAGAAFFPFQRMPGGTIDRGIIGSHAHAQEDQTLFIVGDDRMAYKVGGVQLARISTHAIEQTWQKYASVSDCFGLAYTFNGHKTVYFTFPTEQVPLWETTTWGFDIATGLWHERLSFDMNGTPLGRWRGNCAIEAYGKTFIGDSLTGKIGVLDGALNTEFDDPIYAEAVSPPVGDGVTRHFCSEFQLDMETGVGAISGQGSDPQVMLSMSEDGGHTWLPYEDWASLGPRGAYQTQVFWNRLGSAFSFLFKVRISDPVKRSIIGAHAKLKVGM
jgi:hypothetical protein